VVASLSLGLVAEALGLPPQDFDVTVAFCVLLFYLPLWVIVFASLGAAFTLIHFAASALCSLTSCFPIDVLVLLIAKVFPVGSRPRIFLEQNKNKFVWHGFMHMFVVMALLFSTMFLMQWFSHVIIRLQPIVRSIAYFADFQQAPLYPGVDVNRRLRLHENGIVSYTEKCGVLPHLPHQVDFFQIPLIIGLQFLNTFFPDICISVEKVQ
jgi:hypothetical protein